VINLLPGNLYQIKMSGIGIGLQQMKIPLAIPAKSVVISDHQTFGMYATDQKALDVLTWPDLAELYRKWQEDYIIDAKLFEVMKFLVNRSQQFQRLIPRRQYLARVAVKCDYDGFSFILRGQTLQPLQYPLVSSVDAIK
jgi:hypothetical protein